MPATESGNTAFATLLQQEFEEVDEILTVDRGVMLLTEGQIENHLYLLLSGAVRVFLLTELEEQTIRFGYAGSIVNSLSSFINGRPSEFYIEAVRKTTYKRLPKERIELLVRHQPLSYARFLEMVLVQQIDRERDLLTVSPAERLQRVLNRSPNLFQEIPLKYIASYLRMTPETLSRVRNP
ncbi:MAG: Crp/Fnr family transcriptional regulator [Chitinophagaceae bacterium]|nr:MAG: Crp/Fnr family transcriptional regulator [Chitinophagaceae bacterium]